MRSAAPPCDVTVVAVVNTRIVWAAFMVLWSISDQHAALMLPY